jgi:P2 family phage major capsid protein
MNLSASVRQRLYEHFANTARAYGVTPGIPAVGQNFAATAPITQEVVKKIVQAGAGFLNQIQMVPVGDTAGQKVLVGLSGRVASRTNTGSGGERVPKRLASLGAQNYELKATEFDVALSYADIDTWARFPNFADLYMDAVREAIANDILQAGWTGTTAAAATNIGSNPLLQDLNIGWLQKLRVFNSASQYVIGTGGAPVSVGSTGVFKNLDDLVHEAKQKVAIQFRQRRDLVALVADNVLAAQEDVYYRVNGNTPTEKAVMNGEITRAYAGLPTFAPPFLPNGTLLITPLRNLAVYYQDSSVRRLQRDWPSKNEVQEFNSMNMGYVVQEEFAASLVENITLVS